MSNYDHEQNQKQQIEQLQVDLQVYQQRLRIQQQRLAEQQQRNTILRQELAQKYGLGILALIDGDPRAKVFITSVVEKLVFQDEQGNVISKTDGVPVGQIVEVKLVEPPKRQED